MGITTRFPLVGYFALIKEHFLWIAIVYKVLNKLLESMLKRVLGSLNSKSQSTFVFGRLLLNELLIANKITDYAIREKKDFLQFKDDFEKTYDRVS